MLSLLFCTISVLRPAANRPPLPGPYRGGRKRANTPQGNCLSGLLQARLRPDKRRVGPHTFPLGHHLARLLLRLRFAGINGQTLIATRRHDILKWTGVS